MNYNPFTTNSKSFKTNQGRTHRYLIEEEKHPYDPNDSKYLEEEGIFSSSKKARESEILNLYKQVSRISKLTKPEGTAYAPITHNFNTCR